IRCNQIWAITLPFTMLSHEQECRVVSTVYRCLYTPCGIRTLDPADPQFHPTYGGTQKIRDLAYHQGTTRVFPLGAFYKAYLKVNDFSGEAREWVKERLAMMEPMLREGCIGQLPEIYDGLIPGPSKGCFAQAWSVGEILTVYEMLENKGEQAGTC
ncbi:MAG: glycogen debranching protein, partial [Clostridiales bacterium]|nr:glycogen debranching protein [Candidatus Blautia equi]